MWVTLVQHKKMLSTISQQFSSDISAVVNIEFPCGELRNLYSPQKNVYSPLSTTVSTCCIVRTEPTSLIQSSRHFCRFSASGEKPYSCSTCGARFSQKRNLRNHMKIHTDEPSVCKYCDKKFLIDTSLVQHLKKHEGATVVNCTVCAIPFTSQTYLDKHAKRCAKKEKHQCSQCDKSFLKAGDLVKHNRKHTGNVWVSLCVFWLFVM